MSARRCLVRSSATRYDEADAYSTHAAAFTSEQTPSSSPPAPTSPGARCSSNAALPAMPNALPQALNALAASGPAPLQEAFARFPMLSRMLGTVPALEVIKEELADPTKSRYAHLRARWHRSPRLWWPFAHALIRVNVDRRSEPGRGRHVPSVLEEVVGNGGEARFNAADEDVEISTSKTSWTWTRRSRRTSSCAWNSRVNPRNTRPSPTMSR